VLKKRKFYTLFARNEVLLIGYKVILPTTTTTIRFSLPQCSHVKLKVIDILGREVATLVNGEVHAGEHAVVFDAKGLASGIYFYRLAAGPFVQRKKLAVMR
jgi:hypothetical protein